MNNAMLLYAHLADKELAEKVKGGQKNCYEVLVRRHSQALYRIARMYSFAHNEAEEILCRTYVEVFGDLSKHQSPLSFRTWLTKYMITNCLALKKKANFTEEAVHEPACAQARSAQHYDSGRLLLSHEIPGEVEACIEQLPVPLRSVYILSEIDGYSVPEMSHLLNTSEDNIRMRLEKAKTSLRKTLRRWYQYTDIYHFDRNSCDRIVLHVMQHIDERLDVPLGAPTF